jgi:ethanolamine utilization protein EutQ
MIYSVLKTMLEKGLLKGIFEQTATVPYQAEHEPGGLKLVRGNSVKFDVFDTGNPNNKVFYQELISKDESSMSAGFLTIEKSSFEWELCYEEIDYVIEGTLTVTINGKTFTAYPGDVLYVPSGSKVVWGSPDKAKVFYTTYPANWADLMGS